MAQSLITPVEMYLRLLETDENAHVELIDGEVVVHASPDVAHSFGASGVGAELYIRYQRGRGGPGGWWVLDEVDVLLTAWEQAFRPDLAGWRQEHVPAIPKLRPIRIRPDWVCEVLSPSTKRWDLGPKLQAYLSAGVPYYWILDPAEQKLTAHALAGDVYEVVGVVTRSAPSSLPPFPEAVFDMNELFPITTEQ